VTHITRPREAKNRRPPLKGLSVIIGKLGIQHTVSCQKKEIHNEFLYSVNLEAA